MARYTLIPPKDQAVKKFITEYSIRACLHRESQASKHLFRLSCACLISIILPCAVFITNLKRPSISSSYPPLPCSQIMSLVQKLRQGGDLVHGGFRRGVLQHSGFKRRLSAGRWLWAKEGYGTVGSGGGKATAWWLLAEMNCSTAASKSNEASPHWRPSKAPPVLSNNIAIACHRPKSEHKRSKCYWGAQSG